MTIYLTNKRTSPANSRECFNIRHARLRNIVERIIGVVKRRFRILVVPPEFPMDTQARIPPACCCIHNIIRIYDDEELKDLEHDIDLPLQQNEPEGIYGTLASGVPTSRDRDVMSTQREQLAAAMWTGYVEELARRGIDHVEED